MQSRRFTAQCLHASTEKDSTTGGPASVRDFNPAYDRFGSFSSDRHAPPAHRMSASPQKRTCERLPQDVRSVRLADIRAQVSLTASISALAPNPSVFTNETWWPRVVMLSSCTAKPTL